MDAAIVGKVEKIRSNEKWSLRQKLVGIIINPRQTFEYLANNPDWLTPLVILGVNTFALALAITPQMLKSALIVSSLEISARSFNLLSVVGLIAIVLSVLVSWLLSALILHWICLLFSRGMTTYRTTISLLGYANMPNIIKMFLTALGVFSTGHYKLSSGLLALGIVPENQLFKIILSNVDLISLWAFVLQFFAVSVLFKLSKIKASIICSLFWLTGVMLQFVFSSGV